MFGIFKSRKSALCTAIESQLYVYRTWMEWTLESGRREMTLVVEVEYDIDPSAKNYYPEGLDRIAAAVQEAAKVEPPARVRVIPRLYGG